VAVVNVSFEYVQNTISLLQRKTGCFQLVSKWAWFKLRLQYQLVKKIKVLFGVCSVELAEELFGTLRIWFSSII
jgi:hypothetical protein